MLNVHFVNRKSQIKHIKTRNEFMQTSRIKKVTKTELFETVFSNNLKKLKLESDLKQDILSFLNIVKTDCLKIIKEIDNLFFDVIGKVQEFWNICHYKLLT